MDESIERVFEATIEEGHRRLSRTWPQHLATGAVGGIDVSFGVLAALLVHSRTGNELLAALAFSIGFIALTLARSELFTENFLVPIVSLTTGNGSRRDVARLWSAAALMNLVGGISVMYLVSVAFQDVAPAAAIRGDLYLAHGISWQTFTSAVLAGVVITLMTWMQQGTTVGGKVVAAIGAAFVLSYAHLNHVVVASLEVFAGIFGGQASYGLGDWGGQVWLWAIGNSVGGIGLVTVLRLVQVGPRKISEEQARPTPPSERDMARQRRVRPDQDQQELARQAQAEAEPAEDGTPT